jgi:hypothetical protein
VLNVAYSAKALHRLDGALVVVPLGLRSGELRELSHRLRLIGTPVIGFVMTRVPLRAERTASLAALHHDLGGRPTDRRSWSRRLRRFRNADVGSVRASDG